MKVNEEEPELDPEEAKEIVVKLSLECKRIIQNIWDCKSGIVALNDLNTAYREKLKGLQAAISEVETLSDEVDEEELRSDLKQFAQNHLSNVEHIRASLRKANLSCKLELNNKEKDSLLGSREARAEQVRERRKKASQEQQSKIAAENTENLLSSKKMMENIVKTSTDALETIENSSKTIKDTNKEVKEQGGLIQITHRLVTKLDRRELTDKFLIIFALFFFFGTVIYIFLRRLGLIAY